ncbi:MAG: TetR/AcrR family transcriptional regulator [Novosphingobium sp.]
MKRSFNTENSLSAITRTKIIEAGEALFGEMGVDKTPMRSIATAAGQRNINAVQYHFGDRWGLLTAIFEYREAQLDVLRRELLGQAHAHHNTDDLYWLMRIVFEPNFRHYKYNNGLNYIRLHATYLANIRQRGVLHPVDYASPATIGFREAIGLLRDRLAFPSAWQFNMRLEAIGAMFLNSLIRHDSAPAHRRPDDWILFEELIDMAMAAIAVRPDGRSKAR